MTAARRILTYYLLGVAVMAGLLVVFTAVAVLWHDQGSRLLSLVRSDPMGLARDISIGLLAGGVLVGLFIGGMWEVFVERSGRYQLSFDGRRWRLNRPR